jgi:hypothetical protein
VSECVDPLRDLGLPRRNLRVGPRTLKSDKDSAVSVLLTSASWVLQRLPGQVLEEQRADLIRTLGQSRNLVVEVECLPTPLVRVRDGARLLVEIPAKA